MSALLRFEPLFMERVWGGRRLAERYGKRLPDSGAPIGESWELCDRAQEQSVVREGPLLGATLGELWRSRREQLFGSRAAAWGDRFPLLIKLLDAEDRLSVQVHPPAPLASRLGGEPKTEMWFIAAADPGAHLLAGLRAGANREGFEAALRGAGDVAAQLHRIDVRAGDAIFIPSGRVHAIGPGNLIIEVQQNSDTTYRVWDFGRLGLDGLPRELHVEKSLASIDFADIEPGLARPSGEQLISSAYFVVEHLKLERTARPACACAGEMAILGVLSGSVSCAGSTLAAGEFAIVPADCSHEPLTGPGSLLRVSLPGPG